MVCSAEDTLTGRKVAIKRIANTFADLVDAKRIVREIKLLRHFDGHENIIGILDMITMPPNTVDFNDVYIITDLMESDLDRIISSRQSLTDAHFQYFVYQLLRGMKYLHSANVLHRDLKPGNLLVNANCDLAICDFGLARGVDAEQLDPLTEYVVTRWYRAPELLCDCDEYGPAIDIWAIGCIFGELMLRRPLFQGNNPTDQLQTIVRGLGTPCEADMRFIQRSHPRRSITSMGYQPEVPLERVFPDGDPLAVDLIKKMLVFNPDRRITVEEALNHPYLAKLHNKAEEPRASSPFNFDFERPSLSSGEDIPRHELQELMFGDMMELWRRQQEEMGDAMDTRK